MEIVFRVDPESRLIVEPGKKTARLQVCSKVVRIHLAVDVQFSPDRYVHHVLFRTGLRLERISDQVIDLGCRAASCHINIDCIQGPPGKRDKAGTEPEFLFIDVQKHEAMWSAFVKPPSLQTAWIAIYAAAVQFRVFIGMNMAQSEIIYPFSLQSTDADGDCVRGMAGSRGCGPSRLLPMQHYDIEQAGFQAKGGQSMGKVFPGQFYTGDHDPSVCPLLPGFPAVPEQKQVTGSAAVCIISLIVISPQIIKPDLRMGGDHGQNRASRKSGNYVPVEKISGDEDGFHPVFLRIPGEALKIAQQLIAAALGLFPAQVCVQPGIQMQVCTVDQFHGSAAPPEPAAKYGRRYGFLLFLL